MHSLHSRLAVIVAESTMCYNTTQLLQGLA